MLTRSHVFLQLVPSDVDPSVTRPGRVQVGR